MADINMEKMMTRYALFQTVATQLRKHEGLRLKPYRCTANKLTIGYGRNIEDVGITKAEAEVMLQTDIEIVIADMLELFPAFFDELPESIQVVLCNMRYQLGHSGIRNFKNMIKAVKNKNWNEMIKQMQDSNWYDQTPNRAKELIGMVESVK